MMGTAAVLVRLMCSKLLSYLFLLSGHLLPHFSNVSAFNLPIPFPPVSTSFVHDICLGDEIMQCALPFGERSHDIADIKNRREELPHLSQDRPSEGKTATVFVYDLDADYHLAKGCLLR